MDLSRTPEEEKPHFTMLTKDKKPICRLAYSPAQVSFIPDVLSIIDMAPASFFPLSTLPRFEFYKAAKNNAEAKEWTLFLRYLISRDKVAICTFGCHELFLLPPEDDPEKLKHITACYRIKDSLKMEAEVSGNAIFSGGRRKIRPIQQDPNQRCQMKASEKFIPEVSPKQTITKECNDACSQNSQSVESPPGRRNTISQFESEGYHKESKCKDKQEALNAGMKIHPDCLVSLSQNHSGWIFGAVAELVDNAQDAGASCLDISIRMEYFKKLGKKIPLLVVSDNGCGMTHSDIQRMLTLGHELPKEEDKGSIGRFGVGFKAGSLRLGKDAVVLTQCTETRSIGFLSCSFNQNKENTEVPIITYRKEGKWMEFDLTVHSEMQAEAYLRAVKEYSPFNEYVIGDMFAKLRENGTGTQIYIYNLFTWGSTYALDWDEEVCSGNVVIGKRDIRVRSKRVRSRNGQTSKEVPLDYSLHAYLEVIFLEPRMKIFVQGTMVKTRQLAKSLNKTKVIRDILVGKPVQLTIGRNAEEMKRGNCGVFLYWHGRLIEAYKRVGHMIHSADIGRGIIGVMDVTEIMCGANNEVLILNNKQGFDDSEVYATLEEWLGIKADEYWDENFDNLSVVTNCERVQPDNEWVQCNKCFKWRILQRGFKSESLPDEWFCYMEPFNGSCNILQEQTEAGVVTVGTTRSLGRFSVTNGAQTKVNEVEDEVGEEFENDVETVTKGPFKRLKKGPSPSQRTSSKSETN